MQERKCYQIRALGTAERFFMKTTILYIIMVAESIRYTQMFQFQVIDLFKGLIPKGLYIYY